VEDIDIEINDSWMTPGRYMIRASYKDNTVDYGYGYAEQGMFFGLFGIGDSLEENIKKETCVAIKNLKDARNERRKNDEYLKHLTGLAQNHADKCPKEVIV
jgi:hypothetical protein